MKFRVELSDKAYEVLIEILASRMEVPKSAITKMMTATELKQIIINSIEEQTGLKGLTLDNRFRVYVFPHD